MPGKTGAMELFLASVRAIACQPMPLSVLCRTVIRCHLVNCSRDRDIVPLIEQLPLPTQIQRYLKFDTEHDILVC